MYFNPMRNSGNQSGSYNRFIIDPNNSDQRTAGNNRGGSSDAQIDGRSHLQTSEPQPVVCVSRNDKSKKRSHADMLSQTDNETGEETDDEYDEYLSEDDGRDAESLFQELDITSNTDLNLPGPSSGFGNGEETNEELEEGEFSDEWSETDSHFEELETASASLKSLLLGTSSSMRNMTGLQLQIPRDVQKRSDFLSDMLCVRLKPHQQKALRWIHGREQSVTDPMGGILSDECGSGKTLLLISHLLSCNDGPTLVVGPQFTCKRWFEDLRKLVKSEFRLKVLLYSSSESVSKKLLKLSDYNIVLATYQMLLKEHKTKTKLKNNEPSKPFPLFEIQWNRVILDDAHMINDENKIKCKAACSLLTKYRWIVTGTPIKKFPDDMGPLLRFLNYGELKSYNKLARKCLRFLEKNGNLRELGITVHYQNLYHKIRPIMLRRASVDMMDDSIELFPQRLSEHIMKLELNDREWKCYINHKFSFHPLFTLCDYYVRLLRLRQVCNHPKLCETGPLTLNRKKLLEGEKHIQKFRSYPNEVRKRMMKAFRPGANPSVQRCLVCRESVAEGLVLRCGHVLCPKDYFEYRWRVYHRTCQKYNCQNTEEDEHLSLGEFQRQIQLQVQIEPEKGMGLAADSCDLIREITDSDEMDVESIVRNSGDGDTNMSDANLYDQVSMERNDEPIPIFHEKFQSTKVKTFLSLFENILLNSEDKVLCCSQWTDMLRLIEHHLYCYCDQRKRLRKGQNSTSPQPHFEFVRVQSKDVQRGLAEDSLKEFQRKSSDCRLLLLSSTVCISGIDLTVANHIFLMEPHWNPMVEERIIGRVHCIGQMKPVNVIRLVMKDTVEEKMLELQKTKRALAKGVVDGNAAMRFPGTNWLHTVSTICFGLSVTTLLHTPNNGMLDKSLGAMIYQGRTGPLS